MQDEVTVTVTNAIAEGNHVVIKSDAYGASEMGKIYNEKLCRIFEVHNGKIQTCHEYLDTIHANKVLEERE
jgi:Ketosteroid isomerase-related protein